jgi:tRNA1Val (adenine37-N6)-methyltransferase
MQEEIFRFKQFSVAHNLCAQKVGTDGVLLGAWTDVPESVTHILDIGTGSGLIALMMTQKSNAGIDAFDIDENACKQARLNFNNSLWEERLNVFHSSLQDFIPNKKYDLIVSNPPFFENSLKPDKKERSWARHNDSLSIEDLIVYSKKMLKQEGRLSVIIPFEQKAAFLEIAAKNSFSLKRITNVRGTAASKIKRVLLESAFETELNFEIQENELIIEESRNQYTSAYKNLTKDFYLNF